MVGFWIKHTENSKGKTNMCSKFLSTDSVWNTQIAST